MPIQFPFSLLLAVLFFSSIAAAQQPSEPAVVNDSYVRLLRATKFIDNYKEMAALSARVFSARGQGSDRTYAKLMEVVSVSDLADVEACLAGALSKQGLTPIDADEVSKVFETAIGKKIVFFSQKMLLADIERGDGKHQPLAADTFSDDEKRQLAAVSSNPVFVKYNQVVSTPRYRNSSTVCIQESSAVKKSGVKF